MKKMETSPQFSIFIKNIENKSENLNSFLIMPVQRLPRYQLLIQQLLEHTPTTHIDFSDLNQALEKIKQIAYEINFLKRKDSSVKTISELESKFVNLPFKIAFPSRVYIWKGLLSTGFKTNGNVKPALYILFNNLLVMAKKKSKTKLEYLLHWNFQHGFVFKSLPDSIGVENAFEIIFDDAISKRRLSKVFSCTKNIDKEGWMTSTSQFFENYPKSKLEDTSIDVMERNSTKTNVFQDPLLKESKLTLSDRLKHGSLIRGISTFATPRLFINETHF
eukprot:TRINITY_DN8139_c0_g1_i1.p1 TRINITY_DN8139_c0_g1~~TRINITY_DN8139_c0_g1_i1.p1  ORF type:complete len:276 (-),score=60.95 TRINITY_DN8139_c0_g1_i1:15-842(-)